MPRDDLDRHAERIRALDESWMQAADRRDLDGMMSIYATEAEELLPGLPPIVGRQAIRAFYARIIQQLPRFAHRLEPLDIIVSDSGDLAVVRGRYIFTADTLRPTEVTAGKFVSVWRRTDRDWLLHLDIANADVPAAARRPPES
ncbi:MAG TPA: nuclear transport factor 2 family protein [Gemmatimonadaceae bacterium]|nr:nuclear transport factor 2 family protein [Gemmatimonadaceae bacterium]